MDRRVPDAARQRARPKNRTVKNYIEPVLRWDVNLPPGAEEVEVSAPADSRTYELVRENNESDACFEARKRLISAILDAGGH